MDTVEVRRRFAAYGAGEIPATELRITIRNSLLENPLLASAYVALAEAYRRANVIDAGLQSVINSDIAEVTGPRFAKTRIRPPAQAVDARQSHTQVRTPLKAATSAPTGWSAADPRGEDERYPPRGAPADLGAPSGEAVSPPTTGRTTGGSGGSAWDSIERLTEVAEPLFPGSVLRERFELTEELGRGGMGVVFKAYDRTRVELRDPFVAIKVLNEDFKRHPLAVRALQREARKAQKLAHPNIVTVYDFDRDRGNVYMVMEYLSGRSLDQVINGEAKTGMSVKRALEIVRALAAALTYAHEQDIVHSDLKPSNAFITEDNRIKVLDFGIARAAPSQLERGEKTIFDAGQLGAISPAYASLEMLQGAQPDPRDDIYALACVTYELLSGHHPFNRIDAAKAAAQRLQPVPIRGLTRSQWHGLRRGLAFERAARTPSVAEFVQDLSQKSRRPFMWKSLAAAVVLIGAALGAWQLVLGQYHSLQQEVLSANSDTFRRVLSDLRRYPQVFIDWVLSDEHTRTALDDRFRDQIGQALEAGDYPRAEAALRELRTLLPNEPAAADLARTLEQHRAAQLQQLLQARTQALADSIMVGSQGEQNVTELTRRIVKIDPRRELGSPEVVTAYARTAEEALQTNRPELAGEIVGSGRELFPDDDALRALQERLVGGNGGAPSAASGDAGQLAELLAHPLATQEWAEAVKGQLAGLPPGDERIAQASRVASHTFVNAAGEARKRKDYTEAGRLLETARSFDPQSAEVRDEVAALDHEHGKSDTRVARSAADVLKDKIAVESLKDTLIGQAMNGDIVAANTSAEQLSRALPGSSYVTHDLPQILAKTYENLARRQFAEGHVDAALTTLAAGRRKIPRAEDLQILQQRYTTAGEFYDSLAGAVTLNVTQKKIVLQQLRAAEGEDYPAAEQMFAQTLANRIADQRAANRPTVANGLLSAGRELFPDHAALLTQGTAGILVSEPTGEVPQQTAVAGVRAGGPTVPTPDGAAPSAAAAPPGSSVLRTASSSGEASSSANGAPAPVETEAGGAQSVHPAATAPASTARPAAEQSATSPSADAAAPARASMPLPASSESGAAATTGTEPK